MKIINDDHNITKAVQSVNGKSGPNPVLTPADIGAATADNVLPPVLAGSMGAVRNREGEHLDLLSIDIRAAAGELNAPYIFGVEDTALLVNTPYTGGPFYGFRQVIFGTHLITVVIIEQYPVAGRVWGNTYDNNIQNWRGWHSTTNQ